MVSVVGSLAEVDPHQWDSLVGPDDPFSEHAFLYALEASGAVGAAAGWQPVHLALHEGDRLVAALPLYLKDNSYGEFIFDWGWANAALRAGIAYYPKLVSMTPFTPTVGPSFLVGADHDTRRSERISILTDGAFQLAQLQELSSVHLLFLDDEERTHLSDTFMHRHTMQFHWHNDGYADFDAYLATFRASARKSTRRERRDAAALGLRIEEKVGTELSERDWSALESFYRDTCERHGSPQYLPPTLFSILAEKAHARVVAVLAYDGDEPVAGTLNFEKGGKLYGRYWGAKEEYPFLHFELAYYRLIERAIRLGLHTVEAGAQGIHKLKRGFLPSTIHSAHYVAHPGLADGVGNFLMEERLQTAAQIAELSNHGPFRRGDSK